MTGGRLFFSSTTTERRAQEEEGFIDRDQSQSSNLMHEQEQNKTVNLYIYMLAGNF